MKTILFNNNSELNVYTQSEEDIYASQLTGQPAYSVILFNSTLKQKRYWNGTAFESHNSNVSDIKFSGVNSKINNIQNELKAASLTRFKELIYTNDVLTTMNIWEDETKTHKLYQADYTYSGDDLSTVQVTRIWDNFIYTKQLNYDSGNLVSVNIT